MSCLRAEQYSLSIWDEDEDAKEGENEEEEEEENEEEGIARQVTVNNK